MRVRKTVSCLEHAFLSWNAENLRCTLYITTLGYSKRSSCVSKVKIVGWWGVVVWQFSAPKTNLICSSKFLPNLRKKLHFPQKVGWWCHHVINIVQFCQVVIDMAVPGLSLIVGFGMLGPGSLAIAWCGGLFGPGNLATVFSSREFGPWNLVFECCFWSLESWKPRHWLLVWFVRSWKPGRWLLV